MAELVDTIVPWGSFLLVVVVFGFAPGFMLRLLVMIYPREDPRRAELLAQLYVLRRFERPLFVAEQLETVLFEGLPHRIRAWRRRTRAKRRSRVHAASGLVDHDGVRSVLRKITITTIIGAISFPFTDLLFESVGQQLAMAAGFGAVTLLVQFLIDFEKRLAGVETAQAESVTDMQRVVGQGFAKVSRATELFAQVETAGLQAVALTKLVQHAARINPKTPRLISTFAQGEIDRISELLRGLAECEVARDGEALEWLFSLSGGAEESIDSFNALRIDAAGRVNLWGLDFRRYAEIQRDATRRGIRVRQIFVVDDDTVFETDPKFSAHLCIQAELGIEVRLLNPASARLTTSSLADFILFDNTIAYETAMLASDGRARPSARLILHSADIADRVGMYGDAWDLARSVGSW